MDMLRRIFGSSPTTGPRIMSPSLRSILCGHTSGETVWKRDAYEIAYITFREDGTGDLQFALQTAVYIASAFRWKESPETPEETQPVTTDDDATTETEAEAGGPNPAQPLGAATVEITLTTQLSAEFYGAPRKELLTNEDRLTADAFRPRVYTVRLKQGAFALPRPGSASKRREYRLQMEPSPFPPRSMWKELDEGGVDANRPWEWTTFVGGAQVE